MQTPFFFRRFPQANAKAGLSDLIRNGHALKSGTEAEQISFLWMQPNLQTGGAGCLFSHDFGLWHWRGSGGRSPLPASTHIARQRVYTLGRLALRDDGGRINSLGEKAMSAPGKQKRGCRKTSGTVKERA
jgi:hypothetical protein